VKKLVLVIDDDPNILELIQILLESEGHEALLLASGENVLEVVREAHPNLVLLDIVLHGQHGMEVLAALRETAPDVPVVLLSGAVSQVSDMPDIARALGAHDFIEKPFDAQRLIDTVNRAP
jgi:DNA-binding NtrC family response regulator